MLRWTWIGGALALLAWSLACALAWPLLAAAGEGLALPGGLGGSMEPEVAEALAFAQAAQARLGPLLGWGAWAVGALALLSATALLAALFSALAQGMAALGAAVGAARGRGQPVSGAAAATPAAPVPGG